MNKIYKTVRKVFLGDIVVVSEIAKGKSQSNLSITNQSNSILNMHQHRVLYADQTHNTHYTNPHLTTSLRIVMSALMLTAFGCSVQAGEIINYPGSYPLRNDPLFSSWPNSLFSISSKSNNQVTINAGSVIDGNIHGGVSNFNDHVFNNTVTIKGGSMGQGIFGGASKTGNVTGNKIIFENATVTGDVYGGWSSSGAGATVSGNSVLVKSGTLYWHVIGGNNYAGNAINNSVTIEGGSVGGDVYGGWSDASSASSNHVNIKGGYIAGEVHGGSGNVNSATNNTVNISGTPTFDPNLTHLYGGYSSSSNNNVFSGNALNFSAHRISVHTVANFEHYKFTLNPAYANDPSKVLITAQYIKLGNGTGASSSVEVTGVHSGNPLNVNDTFVLMQATTDLAGDGVGRTTTGIAQQGISLLYDIRTDIDLTGNKVTATILAANPLGRGGGNGGGGSNGGGGGAARVNPQLKALSESYLAGAMLIARGADIVADEAFSAINIQNNKNGWVPFVILSGDHTRYNSGSHIKSNDFLLTGGISYQHNQLTAGAFLEGGWGNYDTYNSFYNAPNVKGDGHSRYYGAGLLGRYDFESGFYADASLRFGRNSNKFDTYDIVNIATGQFAKYTLKSHYVSAHIGAGYVLPLKEKNELDLSAKYLWTRLSGKDVFVAGDPIHFKRIDSSRIRINATLNHLHSQSLTLYAGLGYEYEFDGKANAATYNIYDIDAANVKGGTGILSLGARITPTANQNLSLDLKLNAYAGKREGAGLNIKVNYAF